jgi:hypothetical protein
MAYGVRQIYKLPSGTEILETWPVRQRIAKLQEQAEIVKRTNERTWTDGDSFATRTVYTEYASKDVYDRWVEFLTSKGHQAEIDQHNSDNNITVTESSWAF